MNDRHGSMGRDLGRVVGDWLSEDVTTVGSDRVLAAALVRVSTARQERGRSRLLPSTRSRSAALAWLAGAVAALVLVAVAGTALLPADDVRGRLGAAVGSPAAEESPDPRAHRHPLTVGGVELSYLHSSALARWEQLKDGLYISKNVVGPQGAEAMILWTSFPHSEPARPCLLDPSDASSAADLAAAVATAPGTDLVSGPTDVTVGGRSAKRVVLTILARSPNLEGLPSDWEPGCDPAYFFGWEPFDSGAFWLDTLPGDTIRVWIIEVEGTLLFIQAETRPDAGSRVEQEIDEVIASVRFE